MLFKVLITHANLLQIVYTVFLASYEMFCHIGCLQKSFCRHRQSLQSQWLLDLNIPKNHPFFSKIFHKSGKKNSQTLKRTYKTFANVLIPCICSKMTKFSENVLGQIFLMIDLYMHLLKKRPFSGVASCCTHRLWNDCVWL